MKKLFLFFLLLGSITVYAQQYPEVTIHDIQYVPDSLLVNNVDASLRNGDTVTIVAQVLHKYADDYHRPIMWAGARWTGYICDTAGNAPFSGINLIEQDTTNHTTTLIDLLDSAQIIKVTGKIVEFPRTTQFEPIISIPIEFLGSKEVRPEPMEVSISDFISNNVNNPLAEKYEGSYVVIRNVTTTDRNTGTVANPFAIFDANGNKIVVHGQSQFFTKRDYKTVNRTWEPPIDGTTIPMIRGIIGQNSNGTWVIRPIYPNDVEFGAAPPVISNVLRSKVVVSPTDTVQISAKIVDIDLGDGIAETKLVYSVDGGVKNSINMIKSDSTTYRATIPVQAENALISFSIWAQDNSGKISQSPVDTARNKYFYQVLNRPVTIQDVQFSPFGGGYSQFNDYRVTVSGVVTADTSDLQGDGNQVSRRVHMQNGDGPWSGIQVNGLASDIMRKGENITVTGLIREVNNVTVIDSITSAVVNSTNNPMPNFVVLKTSDVAAKTSGAVEVEQYESVLAKYIDVTVTDVNSDGIDAVNGNGVSNFGEISVADSTNISTRVELQEGNHIYHNGWDSTVIKNSEYVKLVEGNTIEELRGILYYSFGNYKLVPRKGDDFVNVVTSVNEGNKEQLVADRYQLAQNYPNPFNPITTISYSIPVTGKVSIKVFNVLGKEVMTLVNQEQNAGVHKVIFDARSLSSGIYFYQINANNFTSSKKMVLLK